VSPSHNPSVIPTVSPSFNPTVRPSDVPSWQPTVVPSNNPSTTPSASPSQCPSVMPSNPPSVCPTVSPSGFPTVVPTWMPSSNPTVDPSNPPTNLPTVTPSSFPSNTPSNAPSLSPLPDIVSEIRFEADYAKYIGNNKTQFLDECTESLQENMLIGDIYTPVVCEDCRPGSIIVAVSGRKDLVDLAVMELTLNGLNLTSFPHLESIPMRRNSDSGVDHGTTKILGIVALVCLVLIGVFGCCNCYVFKTSGRKNTNIQSVGLLEDP